MNNLLLISAIIILGTICLEVTGNPIGEETPLTDSSDATMDQQIAIIELLLEENGDFLGESPGWFLEQYNAMKELSEEIFQRDPTSEYSLAVLWMAYDYGQFITKQYVVVRRMLETLIDILNSMKNNNNNNPTLMQSPSRYVELLPTLNKEFITKYLAPIVMQRVMLRGYEDLKTMTRENWQRIYHLSDYYIGQHLSRFGRSNEGLKEFIQVTKEIADDYQENMVDRINEIYLSLDAAADSLPHDSPYYEDRDSLKMVVDKLIDYVIDIDHGNDEDIVDDYYDYDRFDLGLPSITSEKEMIIQLANLVPDYITTDIETLGAKLQQQHEEDGEEGDCSMSTSCLTWNWQSSDIKRVTDIELNHFKEHVLEISQGIA